MPWLIALIVMVLSTGIWYQFETQTQRQLQIEQYMATLQVSIRPLLKNKDAELVKAQLNNLRHTSVVPLTSIAIYSQNNTLLAATNMPLTMQHFRVETPVQQFSLQWYNEMLVALQPLTDLANSEPIQAPYFILTVFEPNTTHSIWLLPMLIVALVGGAALLIVQSNLVQQLERQQTDMNLLNHKLSQLRHGQQNVRFNEELVPELAALKPALNALAQYQADMVSQFKSEQLQQQHDIETLQQHITGLSQQLVDAQQQYHLLQQKVQNRWHNLMQLYQQQTELDDNTFRQALSAQLSLLKLDAGPSAESTDFISLTNMVASALPDIQQWLHGTEIELQLFEAADNALFDVKQHSQYLTTLMSALVQLGSRAAAVTELTLRVSLHVNQSEDSARLELSITSNGDGISAALRQRLNGEENSAIQWHEADIGIVLALKQQLNASISIQVLDGLGSTIAFQLPLTTIKAVNTAKLQHLLLFEQPACNLTERSKTFASQAAQLVTCGDLAELTAKSKQYVYDLAIVILPEPTALSQWQALLQQLNSRCRLLCYADSRQLAIWREALQLPVQQGPVCLAHMQATAAAPQQHPRLLVVDDNQTNLAFVQILLKDQAVQLDIANCGTDALKCCQQQQYDVILLDIQLPDISGIEVASQLRQLKSYQHTPILAFTAHALDEEIDAFKQAGMNDVIIKPLAPAKLEQILRWCSVAKADNV